MTTTRNKSQKLDDLRQEILSEKNHLAEIETLISEAIDADNSGISTETRKACCILETDAMRLQHEIVSNCIHEMERKKHELELDLLQSHQPESNKTTTTETQNS